MAKLPIAWGPTILLSAAASLGAALILNPLLPLALLLFGAALWCLLREDTRDDLRKLFRQLTGSITAFAKRWFRAERPSEQSRDSQSDSFQ
jgi:hypothetical protein